MHIHENKGNEKKNFPTKKNGVCCIGEGILLSDPQLIFAERVPPYKWYLN